MSNSAGACQTTDAALKPPCGRASTWSSTITAIGCRCAASSLTSSPVNGAGTSAGVGGGAEGDGLGGGAVGVGATEGATEGSTAVLDGAGVDAGAGEPVAATVPPEASQPSWAAARRARAAIPNPTTPIT